MNMNDQLTLIEAESDEALLLPMAELSKRFTGTTANKIEMKRNYICDLLAFGFPVDSIAVKTGSSTRIVKAIGAICAEQVSHNISDVVKILRQKALKATFYADQKMPEAKLGELSVFIGVALQRAQEAEAAAAGGLGPEDGAIDIETENPAVKSVREFLQQQKSKQLVDGNEKVQV